MSINDYMDNQRSSIWELNKSDVTKRYARL